jgi:hypothetical protein
LADEAVSSLAVAGDVLWPLTDHLGTPRDLATYNATTDDTSIANHRRYDAYGILVSETNSGIDILIGYTGRPFDESTGLNNHKSTMASRKMRISQYQFPGGKYGNQYPRRGAADYGPPRGSI